jgi:hypothetical protein
MHVFFFKSFLFAWIFFRFFPHPPHHFSNGPSLRYSRCCCYYIQWFCIWRQMNRNEKCLIRLRNLFTYLFSFALTKTYTIQVQQFIYMSQMRQNKRRGHHNSLHQLLWALIHQQPRTQDLSLGAGGPKLSWLARLIHQSKRLSPLRWILVQDIHVKELVNALQKVVGFLPQGMLTGWVGIDP